MNTTSELRKIISLMKKQGVTKIKTEDFEIEIDPAVFSLESQKEFLKTLDPKKKEPQTKTKKTEDPLELPVVHEDELTGPFPQF